MARWQLVEAGLTHHEITWRLKSTVLVPIHRGVYAYGHAGATRHSTEIAALLTRGPEALICGHRAAAMWRLRPKCDGVDLLVPAHQGGRHREDIRIHRSGDPVHLRPEFIDGVPVVAPEYALLEIAGDLSTRALELALDEAFSIGRVNRDDIARVLAAHPRWRGAGVLRELLGQRLVGNPSRSHGQERLLALIRSAGLPDPEMDARIGGGFSADFLWRRARVAVEYDSFKWHSSRSAWARDRRKDAHCREIDLELIRVTDEDLVDPLALIARLAAKIGLREAGL